MNPQEQALLERFDEKFGENFVYWQELVAEIHQGDPDFKSLKSFLLESVRAAREEGRNEWENINKQYLSREEAAKQAREEVIEKACEALKKEMEEHDEQEKCLVCAGRQNAIVILQSLK